MTEAQKLQIKKLFADYTKACNTGTGAQAERAERRLLAAIDKASQSK